MTLHGHVIPRADGIKSRCLGVGFCEQCKREQAALTELFETAIAGMGGTSDPRAVAEAVKRWAEWQLR